ncbi:MAG TPA: right-handed parallel beta-helix repeat-containing protein [Tepidisphaeraceae bacterium]|nr:right-handed parallel beta-helix repeat-containing protein [Tepidisphaeraceae bacterium]
MNSPARRAIRFPRPGWAQASASGGVERLEPRVLLSAWYVATNGSDGNAGTLSSPFSTIQHAANLAQPGDTVYVRGGVYHQSVTPPRSGTSSLPITFTPYNNEGVTIDGADPVTGWTKSANAVYSAPQSWDLGEGYNQVFVDGQMVNEARWPNTSLDVSHPVWTTDSSATATISDSGLSTATFSVPALTDPAGTWVGAILHFSAGAKWVAQTGTVTASRPGYLTVSYSQLTSYEVLHSGDRIYLTGKFKALDAAGEWYRDPTTGRLNLWTPASDSPTSHVVEAKARQYAFNLSGRSNIVVHGFSLFANTINTDANSSGIVLDHLNAKYVSHDIGISPDTLNPWNAQYHPHTTGIILNGTHNTLQYSTIAYSSGDGVFLGGSGNTVQDCVIHDVDYEGGDEAGVTTLGSNENVLYNTVYNAGRSGIVIRFTTASHILHNIVHDVGLQMTDLGAIYTWGTDGQGTEIGYNVCYNVRTGGYGAAGIYLDNYSQHYVVDHNVTWNVDFGLKMNPPCWNDTIVNNTFIGVTYGLQSSGNEEMTGSVLYNNIFSSGVMFGPGSVQTNNLFSWTDPKFVSASTHNYQLLAGSPAINTGRVLAPYTNGYTGAAPDIGAYEYGVTAFSAGAPPLPSPVVSSPPTVTATTRNPRVAFNPQSRDIGGSIINAGVGIRFTNQWSWAGYRNVDFGTTIHYVTAKFSHLGTGVQTIQIRRDNTLGTAVANLTIPTATSSSSTATVTAAVTGLTGIHGIYLVLLNLAGGVELDSFVFS